MGSQARGLAGIRAGGLGGRRTICSSQYCRIAPSDASQHSQSQSAPGGAGTASGVGDGQNSCRKSCNASGSTDPGGRSCGTSVLAPILGGMSSPWSGAMRIARKDAATC